VNQICDTGLWNLTFKLIAGYTSYGTSTLDRLYYPADVLFDANDNLYVVDTSNHRVLQFPNG